MTMSTLNNKTVCRPPTESTRYKWKESLARDLKRSLDLERNLRTKMRSPALMPAMNASPAGDAGIKPKSSSRRWPSTTMSTGSVCLLFTALLLHVDSTRERDGRGKEGVVREEKKSSRGRWPSKTSCHKRKPSRIRWL